MANVLSRATPHVYLRSVNDPDYPGADWIHNPDLSAVAGYETRYWVVTGDVVSLMGQGARDAVDAARLAAQKDETAAALEEAQTTLRGFAEVLIDELNRRADDFNAILDAAANATSLASFKIAMGQIRQQPQRTLGDLRTALRNKL